MYRSASSSSAVVVGVDGSRWSVDAALWAIDEAIQRDVPLRLLYVIAPRPHSAFENEQAARDLACADVSIRRVLIAVESTEKPVKVEFEVLQGNPTSVLLEASRSADLLCLGSLGIAHATGKKLGSTAATLSASAHCPIAIVGGGHHRPAPPQHVVVELDESADSTLALDSGISEARLRGGPLTVLTTCKSERTYIRDDNNDENARARLEKRLARYRRVNPDIHFNPVVARGSTLNYIGHQSNSIQLLVVGRHRARGVGEIIGSAHAAPYPLECPLLICGNHSRL